MRVYPFFIVVIVCLMSAEARNSELQKSMSVFECQHLLSNCSMTSAYRAFKPDRHALLEFYFAESKLTAELPHVDPCVGP